MGNLTTLSINNDGIDSILDDSYELCRKIYEASARGVTTTIGHGDNCNLIKLQRPRHADDHTLYVHMGNTVSEMHPYSKDTEDLMKNHPEFFEEMLRFIGNKEKELKRRYKEIKKQSDSE